MHVDTLAKAIAALNERPYDLVLLDLGLPDACGLEGVVQMVHSNPEVALVVLTGLRGDEVGMRAIACGAQDFLIKGQIESGDLAKTLRYAVIRKELEVQKRRFLATISHEMRTPLNFIMGFASCLQDEVGGRLSDQQRRMADGIVEGADRLLALVEDLLDSAHTLAGELNLHRTKVNLDGVVARAVEPLVVLAQEKGIDLGIDASVPVRIEIDDRRVVQVITNLVSNAIKFTSPGGKVRIRTIEDGNRLRIEVLDTGIGIPESFQPRLFNRFSQVPSPPGEPPNGTGLGLSICKAIVEAHGGDIGVRSKPQSGSVFWFSLPKIGAPV